MLIGIEDPFDGSNGLSKLYRTALQGEVLAEILNDLNESPHDFKGGDTTLSKRALKGAARLLIKRYANPGMTRSQLYSPLYSIARDFFVEDAGTPDLKPYGAHHLFGARLVHEVISRLIQPRLTAKEKDLWLSGLLFSRWMEIAQPDNYRDIPAFWSSLEILIPLNFRAPLFDASKALSALIHFIQDPALAGISRRRHERSWRVEETVVDKMVDAILNELEVKGALVTAFSPMKMWFPRSVQKTTKYAA